MQKVAGAVEELLPDRGTFGVLSDLTNSASSRRRSGRAAALAEALEEDAGLTVKNPSATRFATQLLGTLAGAGIGMTAGKAVGHSTPRETFHDGFVGAGVGGLAATLVNVLMRRKETERLKQIAKARFEEGATPLPIADDSNSVAGLVNGAHQLGRADVAETLSFGKRKYDESRGTDVVETAANIPILGKLLLPVTAGKSLVDSAAARKRLAAALPRPTDYKDVRLT